MNMHKTFTFVCLVCIFVSKSFSQDSPFVNYPKETSDYLKRIQTGKAKYKYNPNINFKEWQIQARKELSKIIGLDKITQELEGFKPSIVQIKEETMMINI